MNTDKLIKWGTILAVILLSFFCIKILSKGNETDSLEKVRVQAGWLLNGEFANVCTAITKGYYEEEGLDVELIPGGPVGANFVVATNAIAQDSSIDIAIDGDIIPLLRGIAKKDKEERFKLKAFAAFWNENPLGFLVKSSSGINSIEDFTKLKNDGTKIRLGLTADAVIQYAIAKDLDVSVSDLNIVKTGFDATPLITDGVDALLAYWTTQAYELEAVGIDYGFISAGEIEGFDQPSMVAIASEKTLSERPEMLEKWLRATIKGTQSVIDDPRSAAQDILNERCGGPSFNKEQEFWLINKSLALFDSEKIGDINEQQIKDFSTAYYNIDQIERVPKLEELIDMSILNKVH